MSSSCQRSRFSPDLLSLAVTPPPKIRQTRDPAPFDWEGLPLENRQLILTHLLAISWRYRNAGTLLRLLRTLSLVSSSFTRDEVLPSICMFKGVLLQQNPAPVTAVLKILEPKSIVKVVRTPALHSNTQPAPLIIRLKSEHRQTVIKQVKKQQVLNSFEAKMRCQTKRHNDTQSLQSAQKASMTSDRSTTLNGEDELEKREEA